MTPLGPNQQQPTEPSDALAQAIDCGGVHLSLDGDSAAGRSTLIIPRDDTLRDDLARRETGRKPLARGKLRKWIKAQEEAIEQARSLAAKAREAGNLALSVSALQLATRTQAELIALFAPKKATARSRSAAKAEEAESEEKEHVAPIASETPIDLSKLSDEEVERLATGEVTAMPATPQRRPSSRPRGRSKGCEPTGIAKEGKERALERREIERRDSDAWERPTTGHDAAIWRKLPLPGEWEEE